MNLAEVTCLRAASLIGLNVDDNKNPGNQGAYVLCRIS